MSSNNPDTTASGQPLVGYCHQCDRQVEIDRESYLCTQCNGGFIELFDLERQQESQPQGTGASIRFNNEGMSSMLPFILSHLMNPSRGQADNQGSPSVQQSSTRTGPTRLQFIVPGNRMGETGGQEQFDLYGIINNVISDLLDPRRQGQNNNNGHFHFQSPPIRMFQLHGDMRDYAWGSNGLDTIITQLLNQLENTGPPPASEDQLKNLPQIIITQQDVDKSAQCAICMEDFNLDEKAKKLPCKHLFHEPCISEWLKIHGTCPVCRKNLNGEDTSQREYISRPPQNADAAAAAATNQEANQTSSQSESTSSANNQNTNAYYEPDFD